jgi:hypothetical protein
MSDARRAAALREVFDRLRDRLPSPRREAPIVGMDPETKEDFHGLMRLAEFRNTRVANRRDHEWKVTIGLWTLLALAMISKLQIPAVWRRWPFWSLLAAIVIVHWIGWVRSHWAESRADIQASFFYTGRAHNRVLRDDNDRVEEQRFHGDGPWHISWRERWFGFLRAGRCWVQMLTTAAFAVGVALVAAG